uniref:Dynein regulatory complex protein 1/2 N-terminal domain-containing protein n=1 Tax=Neogobius melanostomus TaxID=47308 RepID=A0A8C6SL14_9GOBI
MSTKRKTAKEGKKVMTEEEKALYLQAQEEKERKKEQTVAQFLKDKVEEDESSSELRMRKLNEGWRILSRLCENEDQKKEIDEMKKSMERQLDGMDDCIQASRSHVFM